MPPHIRSDQTRPDLHSIQDMHTDELLIDEQAEQTSPFLA